MPSSIKYEKLVYRQLDFGMGLERDLGPDEVKSLPVNFTVVLQFIHLVVVLSLSISSIVSTAMESSYCVHIGQHFSRGPAPA